MVNYEEYEHKKHEFLAGIGEWNVYTSPVDEYGRYHKEYVSQKGTWYEVMTPVIERVKAETEVHDLKVEVQQAVKFLRIEFWSTKDPDSKFYYERW
jgi:hypothetical protein